jgi:hypothetical protein
MDFTFGIITGGNDGMINKIIDSIEKQEIPNYEVIIVGVSNIVRDNVTVVPFDETVKAKWITKKKNIITTTAKYDNIVYLHDYIKFGVNWYEGQLKAGENYKVRMDKILTKEGNRFRDWCLWVRNNNEMDAIVFNNRECIIPYDMSHLSKYMYISGSYWIAKKDVMLEFPLDEKLTWGEGEDVEWSKMVRNKYEFNMNPHSTVHLMKGNKNIAFKIASAITIDKLNKLK